MGKNAKLFLSTAIAISFLAGALFITGCAGGDMATVTINIGDHIAQADRPSMVDRIIAFFSLSTRLQADPPPSSIYGIDLTINGPGMETIVRSIPLDTGLITVDVPSGPARVFTIVGYNESDERYMGGIETKDLAPGASETISITMGDLPIAPMNPYAENNYPGITMTWEYNGYPESLVGFIVYRAWQEEGPFVPIAAGRKEDFENNGYRYYDPNGKGSVDSNPSYYKVSATNSYGEGESSYVVHSYC